MVFVILAVLGLVLGSFVNALTWRVHEQARIKGSKRKDKKKELQKLSVLKGHSMCPDCKHRLAAKDLVPVFSWLALKGKCRYCRKKISWQYPIVEAVTAGLFVVSYIFWPFALSGYGLLAFCFWIAFVTGFMALSVYDLRWFKLPNVFVYPLMGLAVVQVALHAAVFAGGIPVVIRALWGVLFAGGIFAAIYLVGELRKQQWIGDGDVRLGVILGLLVGGPLAALVMIFLSSLLGTLASVPLLVSKRLSRKSMIPYGPFLMLATVVMVLFGQPIVVGIRTLFML
jgi:prepilin signal peptidase PulO-like enzyme (type II secretory pathway)